MMTNTRKNFRLALLLAPLLFSLPVVSTVHAASFVTNAPMSSTRRAHTATLLLDGRVLVVGGGDNSGVYLGSAELYDPATGTWLATGSMTDITGYPTNVPSNLRAFHTATLLANGKVLVAGGYGVNCLASAQLYDPASGIWTETGFMNTARRQHTAILLANGKVLVAGGLDALVNSTASAELYDPATGAWTEVGPMNSTRWQHSATLLPDGKVLLVAGGALVNHVSFNLLTSAELYDPLSGSWTTTGNLNLARYDHKAGLLPNGKVLVTGGFDGVNVMASSEIYNPATGTWTNGSPLNVARDTPQATLLPDGKVLVSGGLDNTNNSLSSAEVFDQASGTWTTNGVMNDRRFQHTATVLADGRVLLAGGFASETVILASTELYGSVSTATNGFLKVTISPAGAVSVGAQWQVDGGAFQNTGYVVTNLSGGTHVVSFKTIPGWITPADQLTTIVLRAATNLVSGVYTLNPGAIQVTIDPPGAVAAGAQWQVDGGAFQSSGATVTNVSVGLHTVAFKTTGGWFAPGSRVVSVVSDTTTNLAGTYTLTSGGLQVNLIPAGAVAGGAQWQVDGGAFQPSGAVVDNLSTGDHLLSFKTISGWPTPGNQTVTITTGATNVAVGDYGATGALRVNLNPAGAVSAGARWLVDGGPPQLSGAVVTGLAAGNHTITFSSVAGFITPAGQTNAVTSNVTNTFAGSYLVSELIKPTLTLVTPRSGQRWSNAVFTATGTAKDNVRVAAVYFQLNTNDWATAVLAGNFTNWTASNLVLTPGTNTFRVYAVDASNNRSATNTVKFIYVLSDRLLVQWNGRGTLSPNYSNAVLEIGRNYSMTATAATGFRFVNWTGSAPTNTAKLTFNMQSNLSFTANFVDSSRPVNVVLTPKPNQRWSNQVFSATGRASDNVRVSNVWYQLNGTGWNLAAFALNHTNWTAANLLLTPGTNVISAFAEDATGNRSLTNTVKFVYVLSDRVSVQFAGGRGTLSPNYSNAVLEIGRNYSMTATAASGFRFINWTGSATTSAAKLTFNMQSNLSFTANFLDTSRPVNAITNPVANQKWSNIVFTASGKASDNVGIAGVSYQLNGTGWNLATLAFNHLGWSTPVLTNFLLAGSNQLQAFAVDAVGNASLTNTVNFTYRVQPVADWAPDSLNGLLATVTQSHSGSTNVQAVGFDLVTFALTGRDTNADNYGVGQYLYTKTGTNTAQVALTYTMPPTQSNQEAEVSFVFTNHYSGYFTNDDGDLAGISLVIATNFLPGLVSGKTLVATNPAAATGTSLKFVNRVSFAQTGSGGSGTGLYTLTRYSPVSGMLILTYTNVAKLGQVAYVQTTFTNAANGVFFVNSFDNLGNLQSTSNGKFKLQ